MGSSWDQSDHKWGPFSERRNSAPCVCDSYSRRVVPKGSGAAFPIRALPEDLQVVILRVLLVSERPLTNPWRRCTFKAGADMPYGLNINILATCRVFYEEGMKMLYGENTFRFTRLSSHSNNWNTDWAKFMVDENSPREVHYFLSQTHLFHAGLAPEFSIRAEMIKRVIIHDSDTESDSYAALGYAKDELFHMAGDELFWKFSILRRLEWLGCHLTTLTITLDSELEETIKHLNFEAIIRRTEGVSRGRFMACEEISARASFCRAHGIKRLLGFRQYYQPDNLYGYPGMTIQQLRIRGTDGESSGSRRFNADGSEVGMDPTEKAVHEWLLMTTIDVEMVRCSGRFSKRILQYDGTIPSTFHGGTAIALAWKAFLNEILPKS